MTATGSYGGGSYGCQDWVAPDQCSPMNWYCDGWCQEACKDGWSLTWEWDQAAADAGDWENAHTTVCQKCVVPDGAKTGKLSVFVWESSSNKRICAVGEPVHKEPKPDALKNDWGYDWCEWPAQMDWNKPEEGCFEPSCPHTGYSPQWGQLAGGGGANGSGEDYGQVCLDQEPEKELGCPPGMGVMSIWEEGTELNTWGYYNWEENKYCVKTREMKSLKTPSDDLHKVFHFFDWIVQEEEEGEEPIEDFPEEAITEDFDTTDGEWVEKIEEPVVYEGSEEEFLEDGAMGTYFEDENKHDVEPAGEWETEHHAEDPNLYLDSGMFEEENTTPETLAATGTWEEEDWGTELPATEHYETGSWDSGMDTAAVDNTWDSGMDTAAADNTWDSGMDTTAAGKTGDAANFDSGFEETAKFEEPATAAAGTGNGSGFEETAKFEEPATAAAGTLPPKRRHKRHRHSRHNRRRYDPAMMATHAAAGSGDFYEPATFDYAMDSGFDYMPTGTYDYYTADSGNFDHPPMHPPMKKKLGDPMYYGSGAATFEPAGDFYGSGAATFEPAGDFYGSGAPATFEGDYYGSGFEDPMMYDTAAFYDSGFGGQDDYWPTNDFGDYGAATFEGDYYGSGNHYEPAATFEGDYYGSGFEDPMMYDTAAFYDSGMPEYKEEPHFAGYGSGMPARRHKKTRSHKKRRHSRHH